MAGLKLSVIVFLSLFLIAEGSPLKDKENPVDDQLTSGTVANANAVVPDSEAAATNAKGDLKASDSFGLGYYLPVVAPFVKYHYPLVYYHHPTAYLHSIRHHGYGGYGFYNHGHAVIH